MAAVIKPEHGLDDSSEDISTNPTDSRSFTEVATEHLSRRTVLQGTLAAAATGFFAPAPGHAHGLGRALAPGQDNKPLLGFKPLTIKKATKALGQTITVSPNYEYQVLSPWGTPINP